MSSNQATSASGSLGQLQTASPVSLQEAHKHLVEELRLLNAQMTFNRGIGKIVRLRGPIQDEAAVEQIKRIKDVTETVIAGAQVAAVVAAPIFAGGSILCALGYCLASAVATAGAYSSLLNAHDKWSEPDHSAILVFSDNLILRLELCTSGVVYRVGRILKEVMDVGDTVAHVGEVGSVTAESWRAAFEKVLREWRPYSLLRWNCHKFAFAVIGAGVIRGAKGYEGLPDINRQKTYFFKPCSELYPDVVLRDVARKEDLPVAVAAEEQALRTWQQVEPEFEKEMVTANLKSKVVYSRREPNDNRAWFQRREEARDAKNTAIGEGVGKVLGLSLLNVCPETIPIKRPYTEAPANQEYELTYILLRLLHRIGLEDSELAWELSRAWRP